MTIQRPRSTVNGSRLGSVIGKRIALASVAVLGSLLLLEFGIRMQHRLVEGEPFPADALRERLAPALDLDRVLLQPPALEPVEGIPHLANTVLHPYLGYVFDNSHAGETINRFGFSGVDPLSPKAADEIRVAITGGSVALQLFGPGRATLKRALERSPAFAGKRIEFVALTLGGYKQPQQLMALTWFLALGARFDVVINLDGFNEVVLPYSDNDPVGIHAAYPRSWQLYQSGAVDIGQAIHLRETREILEKQRAWRTDLGTGLAGRSALSLTILSRIDADFAARIAERDASLREALNESGLGFQATGPFVPYPNQNALFRDLVAIWKSSSRLMHELATGSGARYFHFLQPNQWVKDAKPLSGIERGQLQVPGAWPPRDAVGIAYPRLVRAGAQLLQAGVSFTSLTRLFHEERRTVYRDTCCHFNLLGVAAIAEEIGRVVAEETAVTDDRG